MTNTIVSGFSKPDDGTVLFLRISHDASNASAQWTLSAAISRQAWIGISDKAGYATTRCRIGRYARTVVPAGSLSTPHLSTPYTWEMSTCLLPHGRRLAPHF